MSAPAPKVRPPMSLGNTRTPTFRPRAAASQEEISRFVVPSPTVAFQERMAHLAPTEHPYDEIIPANHPELPNIVLGGNTIGNLFVEGQTIWVIFCPITQMNEPFPDLTLPDVVYLPFPDDTLNFKIPTVIFLEFFRAVMNARLANKRLLVNCAKGISRSPTMVIAAIAHMTGIPVQNAVDFVMTKRPQIAPNLNFHLQLESLFELTGWSPEILDFHGECLKNGDQCPFHAVMVTRPVPAVAQGEDPFAL